MKWVDRGSEPSGVAGYAAQFTQGWVDYFENAVGARPSDSYWREFRPALGARTNDNCWYCEMRCNHDPDFPEQSPTVDHFRPLRRFPSLAYAWSNWVYSCRRCNENKADEWPEQGYVDPCSDAAEERPERHFHYDASTGEIVPRSDLSVEARQRALRTIYDLGLNKLDVRYYRHYHTNWFIENLSALPVGKRQDFATVFTEQSAEYAGVTRMVVEQQPNLLR